MYQSNFNMLDPFYIGGDPDDPKKKIRLVRALEAGRPAPLNRMHGMSTPAISSNVMQPMNQAVVPSDWDVTKTVAKAGANLAWDLTGGAAIETAKSAGKIYADVGLGMAGTGFGRVAGGLDYFNVGAAVAGSAATGVLGTVFKNPIRRAVVRSSRAVGFRTQVGELMIKSGGGGVDLAGLSEFLDIPELINVKRLSVGGPGGLQSSLRSVGYDSVPEAIRTVHTPMFAAAKAKPRAFELVRNDAFYNVAPEMRLDLRFRNQGYKEGLKSIPVGKRQWLGSGGDVPMRLSESDMMPGPRQLRTDYDDIMRQQIRAVHGDWRRQAGRIEPYDVFTQDMAARQADVGGYSIFRTGEKTFAESDFYNYGRDFMTPERVEHAMSALSRRAMALDLPEPVRKGLSKLTGLKSMRIGGRFNKFVANRIGDFTDDIGSPFTVFQQGRIPRMGVPDGTHSRFLFRDKPLDLAWDQVGRPLSRDFDPNVIMSTRTSGRMTTRIGMGPQVPGPSYPFEDHLRKIGRISDFDSRPR